MSTARARELLALRGIPFEGDRARVLEELGALVIAGSKPSLRAAAKAAGVANGTAAAWAVRHADFKAAVEFFSKQKPLATPEQTHEAMRRVASGEPVNPVPDFLAFRERHFAYRDSRSGRWVRAVNNWFQIHFVTQLERLRRGVLILPPGHIKTSLTIEYVAWSIFRDRDFRGLGVQKNTGEASKLIAAVQERLACDYYHHAAEQLAAQGDEPITCPVCTHAADRGFVPESKDRGAQWGAQAFKVLGRTSGEKDSTFAAYGVGSQIMGVRSDLIILDDPQDPMDAMRSPKSSEELLEWFQTVILSRVFDHQRVIVLANFVAPDDFAHRLIDLRRSLGRREVPRDSPLLRCWLSRRLRGVHPQG